MNIIKSLIAQREILDTNVKILFKIIQSTSADFERRVTRFTNSQNKTEPRDFYSNDLVQKGIQEKFFRNTNIWYEIRRWEFIKKRPTWIKEIISNEYFGQCYLAYKLAFPEKAKSQTGKIFFNKSENWFYEDIFNKETTFEDLFISWVVFNFLILKEKEYRKKYNIINKKIKENADYELTEVEQDIIANDFLLHSSFHILMIYKKYFDDKGAMYWKKISEDFWYEKDKGKKEEEKNQELEKIYLEVTKKIKKEIMEKKKNPWFTLTKYFKKSESTEDLKSLFLIT